MPLAPSVTWALLFAAALLAWRWWCRREAFVGQFDASAAQGARADRTGAAPSVDPVEPSDDPALAELQALRAEVPAGLVDPSGARELAVEPSEAHAVLAEALQRLRQPATVVALESASKTTNASRALNYLLLCTVYLKARNVVRRVRLHLTRSPSGALYVTEVRGVSDAVDTSHLEPADDAPAFADFVPYTTYEPDAAPVGGPVRRQKQLGECPAGYTMKTVKGAGALAGKTFTRCVRQAPSR